MLSLLIDFRIVRRIRIQRLLNQSAVPFGGNLSIWCYASVTFLYGGIESMSIAENRVEDQPFQSLEMPWAITPFPLFGPSAVVQTGLSNRSIHCLLESRQPGQEIHEDSFCPQDMRLHGPVSYTHLTLPTN